ncbi:hypothetical protein CRUP_006257 [Coryphaenoides rupestris]|nr:hypothetical protein CRUP_006257 [Coryphaenoides rupestris]
MVYYHGVIQQIRKYCQALRDPALKLKWQQVRHELSEEYEQVKGIMGMLESFKVAFSPAHLEERPADPAVWPPPTHAEHRNPAAAPPAVRRPSSAVKPRGVAPGGRPQANAKTERHAARESRGQKVKEDKECQDRPVV